MGGICDVVKSEEKDYYEKLHRLIIEGSCRLLTLHVYFEEFNLIDINSRHRCAMIFYNYTFFIMVSYILPHGSISF